MTKLSKNTWRMLLSMSLVATLLISFNYDAHAQKKKKKKKGKTEQPTTKPKTPPRKPKKGELQPYSKVVTKGAKSDEGLFTVHEIDGK